MYFLITKKISKMENITQKLKSQPLTVAIPVLLGLSERGLITWETALSIEKNLVSDWQLDNGDFWTGISLWDELPF